MADPWTEYAIAQYKQNHPDRKRLKTFVRTEKVDSCLHLYIDPSYGVCDRCGMLAEDIVAERGFL